MLKTNPDGLRLQYKPAVQKNAWVLSSQETPFPSLCSADLHCSEVQLPFFSGPLNAEISFVLEAVPIIPMEAPAQLGKDPNNSSKPAISDLLQWEIL